MNKTIIFGNRNQPSLGISLIPIIILFVTLISILTMSNADAVSEYGPWILLSSAAIALALSLIGGVASRRGLLLGLKRSAIQILPTIPILICIALVATTWMLSGVVPTLIFYGLHILSPQIFLMTTCAVCSVISVLTGSSWTTIATLGVAFMGIGQMMGYSDPWIAGAIISGAYFGDKVSPLSDTTVLASSTVGVDLFEHIRYLMYTTIPAMTIALLVYLCVGLHIGSTKAPDSATMLDSLEATFNLSPWVLIIPAITMLLILLRVPTIKVLISAATLGAFGIVIFQSHNALDFTSFLSSLWSGASLSTGNTSLDNLIVTGGIFGMIPTIFLILSAMIFGSVMMGTGMLAKLTEAFTSRLHRRTSIVSATVCSGLAANCITADQYLSLIITGNMYRSLYRSNGLEARLLGRSIEDSISVTSVLIPWNSCGLTQSTVLGISTFAYFPCCIFNLLSPLMSILMAFIGYKIKQRQPQIQSIGSAIR